MKLGEATVLLCLDGALGSANAPANFAHALVATEMFAVNCAVQQNKNCFDEEFSLLGDCQDSVANVLGKFPS